MEILVVVDATNSRAPDGPATVVAGLSLLERSLRLAEICGGDEILLCTTNPSALPPCDIAHRKISVQPISPGDPLDPRLRPDIVLFLDAETVYDRSYLQQVVKSFTDTDPGEAVRTADALLAMKRLAPDEKLQPTPEKLLKHRYNFPPRLSGGWTVPVDSRRAAQRAERRIWNSCRKPEDGIISRHLNRHFSLAISRRLAPTSLRPDHVTAVTFFLGIAAALAAAIGGYAGFLVAGVLYQLNSIIDGVDGELARARYEFSLRGEWLDTLSDDLSDLLIYLGIGIGAWRTAVDIPGPFEPTAWLVLGIAAAVAKLATIAIYYRWLARRGRGDLLSFQWSFEKNSDGNTTDRILRSLRYLFRKDFVVFLAMIMSFGGYLPHLLLLLAPGNLVVALSVLLQHRKFSAKF